MFAFWALFLILTCVMSYCSCGQGEWPKPASLVGFWPLDNPSGLNDIANGNDLTSTNAKLFPDGPFEQPNTSHSVSSDNFTLGYRPQFDIPLTPALTVSFYFYTKATENAAILMFYNGPKFAIGYREPNDLQVWGGPACDTIIGRFPIIKPNNWNFFAITYLKETGSLIIYDQDGLAIASNFTMDVPINTLNQLHIGGTARCAGPDKNMKQTDAIACLMYYNTVLQPSEIAQLPRVCQTKGSRKEPPAIKPWPRPVSLLGFWPLSSQFNLRDAGPNSFDGSQATPMRHVMATGPYGDPNTAVKPQIDNSQVLTVTTPKWVASNSFTVTLFFSIGDEAKSGGLFEFLDKYDTLNAFQFRYENETTIEVSASEEIIGHYKIIQQKGAWTFVGFVFDSSTKMFTVYSRHGIASPPTYQPDVRPSTIFHNNGIRLGFASRWNQGLASTDKVTCLMIYSTALTASEIRQAYDSCRTVHGSVPCGSSKLPSPMPSSPAVTTVPKPGQFPFIAAVRFGNVRCSANIVDQFWLITSASCLEETRNASLYTVYVGVHDLDVTKSSHTSIHSCSKIVASGNSARDIALIQVTEPIDFANHYVNDACLYRHGSEASHLVFDTPQFVFGWGKNGRVSLVSETLPRYVAGKVLTDDQCLLAWGSGGNYTVGKDLCFTSLSTDKNVPCSGDEGSPLLVQALGNHPKSGNNHQFVQLGVYYKREINCSPLKPGLFANLAEYGDWISEKLACAVPGIAYPETCPQN